MISKMDEMKKDIKELLAKGNGEAQCMDRINTQRIILQLLQEDDEEP